MYSALFIFTVSVIVDYISKIHSIFWKFSKASYHVGDFCRKVNYKMEKKIRKILEEALSDDEIINNINEDTDIIHGIGMNSFEIINFFFGIEEKFEIEIDYESIDINSLHTLSDIIDLINNKKYL